MIDRIKSIAWAILEITLVSGMVATVFLILLAALYGGNPPSC
jgi:hypothetical protein